MLFLMMAALPEGDGPREYLPEEAGNVLDRGEARGLHLLETVREAAGLSRGREARPDVPVTAPDSEIQMSDGENAGEYHRCFICGVF